MTLDKMQERHPFADADIMFIVYFISMAMMMGNLAEKEGLKLCTPVAASQCV